MESDLIQVRVEVTAQCIRESRNRKEPLIALTFALREAGLWNAEAFMEYFLVFKDLTGITGFVKYSLPRLAQELVKRLINHKWAECQPIVFYVWVDPKYVFRISGPTKQELKDNPQLGKVELVSIPFKEIK